MIIGIDIDDTITDTYEVMVNYAQEFTVDVLKREPIIRENSSCIDHFYTKFLHNWKSGEDEEFLEAYYEQIIKNVKPKTLAVKYLRKLQEEGNKIVLITARWTSDKFDVEKLTQEWIKKNGIPSDKLIINAENKLVAANQENIDVFVDDSYKNCEMVSSIGVKVYLMDTRINRGLNNEKIERVYSWPHLYMKLNSK